MEKLKSCFLTIIFTSTAFLTYAQDNLGSIEFIKGKSRHLDYIKVIKNDTVLYDSLLCSGKIICLKPASYRIDFYSVYGDLLSKNILVKPKRNYRIKTPNYKRKDPYSSNLILSRILLLKDTAFLQINIDQVLTCTDETIEMISITKIGKEFKGLYIDKQGEHNTFTDLTNEILFSLIDLETNCKRREWPCFGGFDGQITTYITLKSKNIESRFKYCNDQIEGIYPIINEIINFK